MDTGEYDGYVVRMRGLPWSTSTEELESFLEDCDILGGQGGIHFTFVRDGRPSGEAYIELASEDDLEKALKRDKQNMGKRYIEVFRSKRSEMEWVVKRSGPDQTTANNDAVIRLRGLPFGCSKEEIAHFFSGMEIVPNGITLLQDHQGRTTGDAYVQFASQEIAEKALQKHKERIGHRYIEIFKSSLAEVRNAVTPRMRGPMGGMSGRPSPYDRVDRFGSMGSSSSGSMSSGMGGYGKGRGRGNIKGYFDDGFDDFGSGNFGSSGNNFNRGSTGRRGGMGGNMSSMGGGMSMNSNMGGGMGSSGMGGGRGRFGNVSRGGDGGMGTHESQTGHCIHMRGLPFAANEQDILDFFKPLNPVNVVIHYNNDGRASGEADVDFATHEEAKEAMKKDRSPMQHRYIELFLKSTPGGRQTGSGFGNMSGGGFGNCGNNSGFSNSGSGFGGGNMNNGGFGSGNDDFSFGGRGNFGGGGYGSNSGMGSGMGGGNFGSGMGNMGGNSMGNPNYTAF